MENEIEITHIDGIRDKEEHTDDDWMALAYTSYKFLHIEPEWSTAHTHTTTSHLNCYVYLNVNCNPLVIFEKY